MSGRESGRPSVDGSIRSPERKSSSMNFRYASKLSVWWSMYPRLSAELTASRAAVDPRQRLPRCRGADGRRIRLARHLVVVAVRLRPLGHVVLPRHVRPVQKIREVRPRIVRLMEDDPFVSPPEADSA